MLRKLVTTTTLQRSLLALACLSLACARSSMNPVSVGAGADPPAARRAQQPPAEPSGSTNGAAGDMPAYYDAQLFTINFTELSSPAEAAILGHNANFNIIYTSEAEIPGSGEFISVLDAIQGDGFNPLWREIEITFNPGFTPRQLFSDDDVEAAASGTSPEITLTVTDEVYRCSVVGKK